jgi:hypothetical protein
MTIKLKMIRKMYSRLWDIKEFIVGKLIQVKYLKKQKLN